MDVDRPPPRILVVDDEENIRVLLAVSLRFVGYDVTTASNGRDALELVTARTPDLLVLDVLLPELDGFTVARLLRRRGVMSPILFLTACDEPVYRIAGQAAGGNDFIVKPFSLEHVRATIQALLSAH